MENRPTILIVEDALVSRMVLREIFQDDYHIIEAGDGVEALSVLSEEGDNIALVLLDVIMPVMDGFEVLRHMNESHQIDRIPVIMITANDTAESEIRGHSLGVSDYIIKPFNPQIVHRRVKNVLELYQHKNSLETIVEKQTRLIRENNDAIVEVLSTAIEYRSLESGQHVKRMRVFTKILLESVSMLYKEYGLYPSLINTIASASALHDIGKIAIPDVILLKPGKLTPEEFEIMKTHAQKGAEILRSVTNVWDTSYTQYAYAICKHHHERWDGKGYPDGLVGDQIHIGIQAVSLTDAYDALVSNRVYKKAYSHDEAVRMIINGECGMMSPKIIECFKRVNELFRRYESMSAEESAALIKSWQ